MPQKHQLCFKKSQKIQKEDTAWSNQILIPYYLCKTFFCEDLMKLEEKGHFIIVFKFWLLLFAKRIQHFCYIGEILDEKAISLTVVMTVSLQVRLFFSLINSTQFGSEEFWASDSASIVSTFPI